MLLTFLEIYVKFNNHEHGKFYLADWRRVVDDYSDICADIHAPQQG
jgi:hypothetical protein